MSKYCYLVLGPESSGTKLLTQCLISVGCAGSESDEQPWDISLDGTPDIIVWRRSLPHGGGWPNLNEMLVLLSRRGYVARVFGVIRNQYCTAKSQVRQGHVSSVGEADVNIRRAVKEIATFVESHHLDCRWITYETMVHETQIFRAMLSEWFLQLPTINDENRKY